MAIGIEKGYIVPVNLILFDTGRVGYKRALADSANQTALNGKARVSAKEKRDRAVAAATSLREAALSDLDDAYENSTGFRGYVPSDDISVYGALEEMGANDLDYTFQRTLQEMYKFQVLRHQTA